MKTVEEICADFGISRSALYRRARLDSWGKRSGNEGVDRNLFISRMFKQLEEQLLGLRHGDEGTDKTDIAALNNLAKTFEKLLELQRDQTEIVAERGNSDAVAELRKLIMAATAVADE